MCVCERERERERETEREREKGKEKKKERKRKEEGKKKEKKGLRESIKRTGKQRRDKGDEGFTISQNMENKYGIKGKEVGVDNEKMEIKEVM